MKQWKKLNEKQVLEKAAAMGKNYAKRNLVVGLVGLLGAGKTTFTKAFAKSLGIKRVKSPTFIVAAEYNLDKKRKKFHHIDFYRLNKLDELQVLGLQDILDSKHRIVFIEWVDKFPTIIKRCDLILKFKINRDKTRNVQIIRN